MGGEVVLVQWANDPSVHGAPERRRRSRQRRVHVLCGVEPWSGRTGEKPGGHVGLRRRRRLGVLVRGSSAVPVLATEVRAALVPNFTTEAAEVAREAHEAAENRLHRGGGTGRRSGGDGRRPAAGGEGT